MVDLPYHQRTQHILFQKDFIWIKNRFGECQVQIFSILLCAVLTVFVKKF